MSIFIRLKSFVYGVAMAVAFLAAFSVAVELPNLFAAGEVISAEKMNQNFTALETAVNALASDGSVTSARIAANAVDAPRILDEPGVAQSVSSQAVELNSGVTVVASSTLKPPTRGFAFVIGSVEVRTRHVTGFESSVICGISANADGSRPNDQLKNFIVPANAPTADNYRSVIASSRIFPVLDVDTKFSLSCTETSGSSTANEATLSVLFIPSAYGEVQ